MENAIAVSLFKEGNSPSRNVESQETKCMAAFLATEEGSAILYEAVKKFMSTSDGIMIVENAIVAAVGRRDWKNNNRSVLESRRRRSK
ncbi:uncharacterized protein LOC116934708 [Daphnia magna]|uniref:Uncharacterized protein n=2 Tax=Daphnia magna TaxID=35525 RepID=A0ABQ9YQ55_9CRUS|nr:uncharacterized protein LOC116934708 [Daphnia magna]KAK4002758.1 hypothetical protein OUZ56_004560 [Daphnia magna]KZS18857.1 Uncharacterized protein APZ42_015462 [Daphnia magna]